MAILIVEPNEKDAQHLADTVRRQGHVPVMTDGVPSALHVLKREVPELVLLNVNGNAPRALDFLAQSHCRGQDPPVIVIAARASLEDATLLMQSGAYDYWVKPIPEERLAKTIELLAKRAAPATACGAGAARAIIAGNPAMLDLTHLARRIAASSASVLIQGESGTGKELFARYIHQHSDRRERPFIAVNCAALPEGLLESELFGHEKGAFTGAIKTREGKFELASSGTLLLDEITEIPVHLQAKLLRVLQEHEIDRVGGKLPVPIDVRVIATTNVDVNKAIVEGRFRKDLYYRLNVIPVNIPPLRARLDDLPSLTEHFVEKYVRLHGRRDLRITPSFLRALRQHDWPGNVRELENVVQRAVLLAGENGLTPDCLLLDGKPAESSSSIELMPISAMERLLIHKALGSCQGNRTRAAEILGISVRTLRNKLHEYRQDPLATALPADPEHA